MHGLAYVICLRFQSLADAKQFAELEGIELKAMGKSDYREENVPLEK